MKYSFDEGKTRYRIGQAVKVYEDGDDRKLIGRGKVAFQTGKYEYEIAGIEGRHNENNIKPDFSIE